MVVTNGQSTIEPNRPPDGVVVVVLFGRETFEIGGVALALLHRMRRPASTNGQASTATSQVSTESCVGGLGKLDDAALQRDCHSVSPVVCI